MTELSEAYSDLLQQYPWDYYLTVTYAIRRRDAIRAAQTLWRLLDQKFDASRAFIGAELHQLGGIHLHALTRHLLNPAIKAISIKRYMEKAFGWTTCEPCRSEAQVSSYCSKYVSKGGQYFFYGDTQHTWLEDMVVLVEQVATEVRPQECAVSTQPALWQPALPGLDWHGRMVEMGGDYGQKCDGKTLRGGRPQ